jgi:hypothetical protein
MESLNDPPEGMEKSKATMHRRTPRVYASAIPRVQHGFSKFTKPDILPQA